LLCTLVEHLLPSVLPTGGAAFELTLLLRALFPRSAAQSVRSKRRSRGNQDSIDRAESVSQIALGEESLYASGLARCRP